MGFSFGAANSSINAAETTHAHKDGAGEVDMIINATTKGYERKRQRPTLKPCAMQSIARC